MIPVLWEGQLTSCVLLTQLLVTTVLLDGKFHTLHFWLLYPVRPTHTVLLMMSIVQARKTRFKTRLGDSSSTPVGSDGVTINKDDLTPCPITQCLKEGICFYNLNEGPSLH